MFDFFYVYILGSEQLFWNILTFVNLLLFFKFYIIFILFWFLKFKKKYRNPCVKKCMTDYLRASLPCPFRNNEALLIDISLPSWSCTLVYLCPCRFQIFTSLFWMLTPLIALLYMFQEEYFSVLPCVPEKHEAISLNNTPLDILLACVAFLRFKPMQKSYFTNVDRSS